MPTADDSPRAKQLPQTVVFALLACATLVLALLPGAPARASDGIVEAPPVFGIETRFGPAPGTATLSAELSERYSAKQWSEYFFAYGPGKKGETTECAPSSSTKVPAGPLQEGRVSAEITGLLPNTEYSDCLFAGDGAGDWLFGEYGSFQTPPIRATVDGESVSAITATGATLEARIDPNNNPLTRYTFSYYSAAQSSAHATTLSGGPIAAGYSDQAVRAPIATALAPNTTYYYWAVVQSPAGEDLGTVESFTTLPAPEQPGGSAGSGSAGGSGGTGSNEGADSGAGAGSSGASSNAAGASGNGAAGDGLQGSLSLLTSSVSLARGFTHTLTKPMASITAARLAKALKACQARSTHKQRVRCKERARARYGADVKHSSTVGK
jgi:uncharacterized membrane protein YgcG